MSKLWFVFIPLLLASPVVGAAIFKCTKGGETVYQNFPCSVDSIGSQATAPKPPETAASVAPQESTAPATPSTFIDPTFGKLVNGRYEPRVGMSWGQVRRLSWGEPESIERTESGEGHIEIWTYPDKRKLVFDNGRVSSIQNQ